jgi:hypothetical protein
MIRIRASLSVFGIAALLAIVVACGGEKADEPAAADTAGLPLAPSTGVVSSGEAIEEPVDDGSVAVVSGSMMIPRARTADELVDRSQIIVIGTITSVLAQTEFGGYGAADEDEPVEEGSDPITDYDVGIEMLIKGDGTIVEGGNFVLRMYGHLDGQSDAITLNVFTLPEPGAHLMFALGRNPDGTYGSGPDGLINVDGDVVAFSDGMQFGEGVAPDAFVEQVMAAASQ